MYIKKETSKIRCGLFSKQDNNKGREQNHLLLLYHKLNIEVWLNFVKVKWKLCQRFRHLTLNLIKNVNDNEIKY